MGDDRQGEVDHGKVNLPPEEATSHNQSAVNSYI